LSLLQRLAGFLIPALLLISCAALSPAGAGIKLLKTAVPEAFAPQWQAFARGIDYCEGAIQKPRLKLWALRVDLAEPSLAIVVNGDEPRLPGEAPGRVLSVTTSGFTERYHCAAGINANPFSPSSAKEGEERTVTGIAVSGGRVVSPPQPPYDALVFYAAGEAAIVNQGAIGDLEAVRNAVGGFFRVLEGGAVPERVKTKTPRHPRSAAGLSGDGKILYLLVIDGRRAGSVGATEAETGVILKQLGAASGLNFDGGGSTALALRYPGGRVRTVNTPVHGGVPGRERGVAICLGIRVLYTP
jgi:hypothetical protein